MTRNLQLSLKEPYRIHENPVKSDRIHEKLSKRLVSAIVACCLAILWYGLQLKPISF